MAQKRFFSAESNSRREPTTPEEAVWRQATERRTQNYTALRPDSFCEWSVKNQMAELAQEDVAEMMRFWYEQAVDEQKKELREYKKKAKALPPQIEPIPLTVGDIEEDLPLVRGDRLDRMEFKDFK